MRDRGCQPFRLIKVLLAGGVVFLFLTGLSGCVATTKRQNVGFQPTVTATLPEAVAIQHLRSLPVDVEGRACGYSRRGLAGKEGFDHTGFMPYAAWHVAGIGEYRGINSEGVGILLRGDQDHSKTVFGKNCWVYYRKGARLTPSSKAALNKALTALVSLGVGFDAAANNEW